MRQFDEELKGLFKQIQKMGSLTTSMIQLAVSGLVRRDASSSGQVFELEQQVNALQVEIDARAVRLTALRQPMAGDVRFLFMASRIGGELERIADQAVNISQNTQFVLKEPRPQSRPDLPTMAQLAERMVRDSLDAMAGRDVTRANQVLEQEKRVDALRNEIFQELLREMAANPGVIGADLSLILIARNLERIGDHATNIAEEVIFWIQGRDVRHGSVKGS